MPDTISRGDRIRITVPGLAPFPAGWMEGEVLDAHYWGPKDGWYIEFVKDKVSSSDIELGYGYWQQGVEGGTVQVVS